MPRALVFIAALIFVALPAPPAVAASLDSILKPKSGNVIYVRRKQAKNKNPGTQDAPLKNLDKAIEKAKPGDTIVVAGGRYKGTFGVGLWEIDKDLHLYGGFNKDFTERDVQKFPTLLQPDDKRFDKSGVKPFMSTKTGFKSKDLIIDGFVFDHGEMTPYDTKGQPKGVSTGMMKIGPGAKNPATACLNVQGANIRIRNNVFANCAGGGVRVGLDSGEGVTIENNVFVAARFAAISSRGLAKQGSGKTVIRHNTILFTWTRLKDMNSQGYGVEVLKNTPYLIEHNIIALNVGPGINSQRFNQDLEMNNNVFWGNKKKDLWFNPKSNTNIQINAEEFEDLDFDNEGNVNALKKIPVDGAYTNGVISVTYTEKVDYDPDSQANLMRELFGLNKQGKIKSKVTMFANKYPVDNAIGLFGALKDAGAQKPQ